MKGMIASMKHELGLEIHDFTDIIDTKHFSLDYSIAEIVQNAIRNDVNLSMVCQHMDCEAAGQ